MKWCVDCEAWICRECVDMHSRVRIFKGHTLVDEPPPVPFWEELNYEHDNNEFEIFTVDFNDPRLIKRHPMNWKDRINAASPSDTVPVVSFVGPTGSGKSFLVTSLLGNIFPAFQQFFFFMPPRPSISS